MGAGALFGPHSHASSPCCAGTYSPTNRTTPTHAPPSCAQRSAGYTSPPAPRHPQHTPKAAPATKSASSPNKPKRLSATRRRLESSGCERDTGARISKAHKGQSRASGHEPLTPALRYVSHSHPPPLSHKKPPIRPQPLTFIPTTTAGSLILKVTWDRVAVIPPNFSSDAPCMMSL